MTFSEIFKKAFLDGYQAPDITTVFVLTTLAITALVGVYIFLIYRLTTSKVFYSHSFSISLVATALITATIIFTIQSSVVISLGMVGALSIVRFRTAIKDPMDLVYLFWAISVGIICGAGLAEFAVILSLLLTLVIVCLSRMKHIGHPQILVINARTPDLDLQILEEVSKQSKKFKVKSRNSSKLSYNIVIELDVPETNTLITTLGAIDGVLNVSLIAHNGEVTY